MPRYLLALLLPAAALAAPKPKEPAWHPTAKGTAWVHLITGEGDASEFRTRIAEVEATDTGTVLTIALGEDVPKYRKVLVNADGVFIVAYFGQPSDPHQILKHPLRPKDTWEYDTGTAGKPGTKFKFTAEGMEEVKVPAGTYQAMRVAVMPSEGDGSTDWYAPGVGLVRKRTKNKEWVLTKFTPGK